VLLVLEFPTAFICALALMSGAGSRVGMSQPVSFLTLLLWVIAAVFIAVRGSALIAGERQRETLDVLLSCPLWSREIVSQKMRGVRRLMTVLALPLLTCILSQTFWRSEAGRFGSFGSYGIPDSAGLYLIVSLLCVAIQLPLAAWIGLYFSLRVRSQTRAILITTFALVGWVMAGLFATSFAGPMDFQFDGGQPVTSYIAQALCPPLAILAAENGLLTYSGGFAWWLPCMGMHWLMTRAFASYVRCRSARWLGRAEWQQQSPDLELIT
jgi:ABC-type transport system involved in multi-copper enzyme maturation permease subunit